MKYWLMKTEPSVFSFQDLLSSKNQTTHWEGVRNYQARNFMRDQFSKGDLVLIYHSNIKEPGIAGVAEVNREAYPDDSAQDSKSKYFDEGSSEKNRWVRVDVKAKHALKTFVTREMLQKEARLKKMAVLQKGSRLSIQPVTKSEFEAVYEIGMNRFTKGE